MKNVACLHPARSIFCVVRYNLRAISVARLICAGLLAVVGMACPAVEAQTAHFSWGQTTIGSGLQNAAGVAVDASGNVYIADGAHNRVLKETPSGGGYIQATVVSGLNTPVGLAVDGDGNVYTSTGGNQVLKETLSGGSYTQTVVASGLSNPNSVAVDGSGNVFIVDVNNHRVLKETPSGGSYTETTIGTGLSIPTGVAVDGSGNVYIFDRGTDQVVKETLSGGTYTQTSTSFPTGSISNDAGKIAVDSGGNIYISVSDSINNKNFVLKGTPSGGSYALTTIGSGLSGPYGVAVDGKGNVYIADASNSRVLKVQPAGVDFGAVNVGSASTAISLTFTFDTAGTLGSLPSVLTQGAAGLDFTDAGTGSCTTNGTAHSYAAGDTCTVNVTFTPKFAGTRYGAAALQDGSGNTIATGYVYGTGSGPQVAFSPGTLSTLGSGLTSAYGVAVDGSGNVFVADYSGNEVKEIVAVGGYTTVKTLGSGFSRPYSVAVDGSGNVFVADALNNAVKEILAAGGYTVVKTLGSGFNSPRGVAVDGSGNVFVVDSGNNAVKEILAAGGYTTVKTLATGFNSPIGIAVDGSGNVFVADTYNDAVKEIVAVGGYTTVKTLGSGFNKPFGIAVDGSGNVFVADASNGAVKEILAVGGYTTVKTLGSFSNPRDVALDGSGNVYVANALTNVVTKMDFADAPALNFAATAVGSTSTDSPRTVTVENIGNADLSFLVPATGNNPSIATGFTLGNSGTCPQLNTSSNVATLAQGTSCTMLVSFSPTTAGSNSGSLILTDDHLNASPGTTQTIALSGTATAAGTATHFSVTGPNPLVSYNTYGFTVTALDAGNTVATGYNGAAALSSSDPGFVNLGPVTLVNGVGSVNAAFKTAGIQTLVATDTANSAITGTAGFTVQPGPATYLNISAPARAVAGTAVSLTVYASDLYGNLATSYTGTVHFTSSDGNATLPADATLTGGTGIFSATLKTPGSQTIMATDAVNSLSTTSGGFTVTAPNFVVTTAGDGIAPAINLTGPLSSYNSGGEIDGFAFKATKNVTVSSLGVFAGPSLTLPVGSSFNVGLWTSSGTLLASATVTPSDTVIGSFYYHPITPVALTAGQSYVVGAQMGSGVQTYFGGTYTMADGIQFQGNRWETSSSLVMPTGYDGTPNDPGFLGASFLVDGGGTGGASDCIAQTTPGIGTDAGCSLRDALLAAASAGAGNITFDATAFATPQTIGLGSGTLTLPSNTAVQGRTAGSGASLTNLVTVSGGGSAPVFTVGSGVVNASLSNLIITGGNSSSGGGGIYNDGVLTVSNSAIAGNKTSNGGGGGILNTGTLILTNGSVTGNTVPANGGGLFSTGTLTLINSTISGNTAPSNGGGIYNNGGTLVLTGSTVSGNGSSGGGGGIINALGSLTIANSIVAGNSAGIGADIYGAYTDGGGNIASSDSSGTSAIAIKLAPLGSYGGPLQTMLPLPGSPAICAAVIANIPGGITTDERGVARTTTYGSTPCVDAGAVQTNYAMSFTTQPGASQIPGTAFPAAVTLTENGQPATGVRIPLMLTGGGTLAGGSAATDAIGVATYSLTVNSAVTLTGLTLTATLPAPPMLTAVSDSFSVISPQATHFTVSAPSSTLGGAAFNVTITALNSANSVDPGYSGTVHFTSTDIAAGLPADATLSSGVGTFAVTLRSGGNQTITATDTVSSITGTSASIAVSTLTASVNLALTPNPAGYKTPVTLTATVLDQNSAVVTAGIVKFCDATAAVCEGAALFGTAQLTSSGAVLKMPFGVGSHSIKAVFAGTNSVSAASSSPQSLTVDPPATYPTTTAIASSGVAGNYTLTATVAGVDSSTLAPTGDVSFLDTTNSNALLGTVTLGSGVTAQSFAAQQTYTVGGNPYGVVIKDVNGDGIADLITTNQIDASISVLLGHGDGTFASAVSYPSGNAPWGLIVEDLNGDGIPDIAATNYTENMVSVLIGVGDGTFNSKVSYATGPLPTGLAVGDMNGDGVPDLIVANHSGGPGSLSVLLGRGDGTFSSAITHSSGNGPYAVAVGDFNGDGKLDVVEANIGATNISVLLGNGNGTLQAQTLYTLPNVSTGVLVGDFNGDGKPDLAVADQNQVSILLGVGDGTFAAPVSYPAGITAYALTSGDFNADGKIDLAVTNVNGGNVSILFGNGDGTFAAPRNYATGNSPQFVASGDLNGDGAADLVVVNGSDSTASILLYTITTTAQAVLTNLSVPGSGIHNVNASFAGDTNFASSVSATTPLTGSQVATVLTLATPVPTSSTFGQSVTMVATLSPYTVSGHSNDGELVSFFNGATSLGTAELVSGVATFTTAALPAGTASLTAVYTADANFLGSTSSAQSYIVSQATLTVTANNATKVYGAANPAFTGTVGGEVNGDIFTKSFTTTAGTSSPVGSYAIVPSVMGANLSSYTQSVTNGALTITQAGSSTVLTSVLTASGQSLSVGTAVTFIATVGSSTSGTPTGAVTFLDGTSILASIPVSGGVASYSTSALSAGPHTISATYSGDTNFTASGSNAVSETVSDFTLSFSSPQTILPGHSAIFSLTATPVYGTYDLPITLSVSGLPAGGTATFSSTSLTPGSNAVTATLTIQAPSQSAQGGPSSGTRYAVPVLLGFLLPLAGMRRGRRKLQRYGFLLLFAVLSFGVVTGLSGCGAGGFFNQVAQTYNVTVTGSSGAVQRSTTVALTVQ